jgi:DNA repair protein RadC
VQVGQRLLQTLGGISGLHRASFEEVCAQHEHAEAKTAQIKGAIELGRRMNQESTGERPSVNSHADVAALVQYVMRVLEQDDTQFFLLNTCNRVQKIETIYRGSLKTFQVRVGEVFKAIIRLKAAAIIAVHNHPDGDPIPSSISPSHEQLSKPENC